MACPAAGASAAAAAAAVGVDTVYDRFWDYNDDELQAPSIRPSQIAKIVEREVRFFVHPGVSCLCTAGYYF